MNLVEKCATLTPRLACNPRRSFLQKLGLGLSGVVGAAASAEVKPLGAASDLAVLEAEAQIRALQLEFEQRLDEWRWQELAVLFAEDAEVIFNGGVYSGRDQGISRLFCRQFAAGQTGRRLRPAPGSAMALPQSEEYVGVAADLGSARATFRFSLQVGRPLVTENSLAAMARLQEEGRCQWWETGLYRIDYQRESVAHGWRIGRLVFETRARADYREGRSQVRPIEVAALAVCFPADPTGPDRLA